jgi:3-phosphoshikimate 1-carboxyvinyltransferase
VALDDGDDLLRRRDVVVGPRRAVRGVDGAELVGEVGGGLDRGVATAHAPILAPATRRTRRGAVRDHGVVTTPWPAPTASGPITGTVSVPGSKSVTNRALLLAALSGGEASVAGAPATRDTALMVGALRALGVPGRGGRRARRVRGARPLRGGAVDCGLAGTVMRFVPPAAALADGPVAFDGRPAGAGAADGRGAGRAAGAGRRIDGDALPFVLHGAGGLPGGDVVVDASASSQFVSGLLLSGARYDEGASRCATTGAGAVAARTST